MKALEGLGKWAKQGDEGEWVAPLMLRLRGGLVVPALVQFFDAWGHNQTLDTKAGCYRLPC